MMSSQQSLPDYCSEEERLNSYKDWPVPHQDPAELAAAGFYYTGENDTVTCFECKLTINDWEIGDNPMTEHQRWQEDCRLIRKIPCGNIPIGTDPATIPRCRRRRRPYGIEIRPEATADCHETRHPGTPGMVTLPGMATRGRKTAAFPQYLEYEARLKTFARWPKALEQSKEALADAGFYYLLVGDHTQCHFCGGALQDWGTTDEPWTMHAKWFPNCHYLTSIKGPSFVKKMNEPSILPPNIEDTSVACLSSQQKDVAPQIGRIRSLTTEINNLLSDNKCQRILRSAASTSAARMDQEGIKNVVDSNVCRICCCTNIATIFFPCDNAVACMGCAASMTKCLSCKQTIRHATKIMIVHEYCREKTKIVIVPSIVSGE